mmetsp:Transcript_10479/g.17321  ORF Transcript_10479/g.17321 Transcript_10479/m.17321 type:complete len:86 (-) Transcript_10479:71-328(-)|eukprot:scaffold1366_cov155-Skeletonema_menzelii.AAC.10
MKDPKAAVELDTKLATAIISHDLKLKPRECKKATLHRMGRLLWRPVLDEAASPDYAKGWCPYRFGWRVHFMSKYNPWIFGRLSFG